MALQLRRGETRSFGKMIAVSFAVMALIAQPLVSLNIPSAFALGGGSTYYVATTGSDSTACGNADPCKTINEALNKATSGDTIVVASGVYSEVISLNKAIAIHGSGIDHTIIKSPVTNTTNHVFQIADVNGGFAGDAISGLTIDGNGDNIHGINLVNSTGVSLWQVNAINNGKTGINITSSEVVGTDLRASSNSWHGIDVDRSNNTSLRKGHLELAGNNVIDPGIYVDNVNDGEVVFRAPEQQAPYQTVNNPVDNDNNQHDVAYMLRPAAPDINSFYFAKGYTATSGVANGSTVNWDYAQNHAVTQAGDEFMGTVYWAQAGGKSQVSMYGPDGSKIATTTDKDVHNKYRFYGFGQHGDGVYTMTVKKHDTATGLYSNATVFKVTYDTTGPVVTVTPSVSGVLHGNVSFDVSVQDNNLDTNKLKNVKLIFSNGSDWAQRVEKTVDLSTGHATMEVDTTKLSDANGSGQQSGYQLRIPTFNDLAGNPAKGGSTTSGPYDMYFKWYAIDNTVPTINSLKIEQHGQDISGGVTNERYINVRWSSNDSDIDHYVYENRNGEHDMGLGTQFSGNIGGSDGVYTYKVYAVDSVGNVGPAKSVSVTFDSIAPTIPVLDAALNGAYFNTTPIKNSWLASTDVNGSGVAGYQVAYSYGDGHPFGNDADWTTVTINGHTKLTRYTTNLITSTFRNHLPNSSEQGPVTVWVRSIDFAGNVSAWSASATYTFDSIVPVVTISGQSVKVGSDLYFKTARNVQVDVNETNLGVTKVYKDDGTEVLTDETYNSASFTLGQGLSEGKYYVVHTDEANNISDKVYFIIANTKPAIENVDIKKFVSENVSDSQKVTFDVNNNGGTDVAGVVYKINKYDDTMTNNRGAQVFSDTVSNTVYEIDLASAMNKLVDGEKYVLMIQAANIADVHDTQYFTFTVDNTAPELEVTGTRYNSDDGTYTIFGRTTDPASKVVVTIDDNLLTPAVLNGNGWSVKTGVLLDGNHKVVVTSTDAAGNNRGNVTYNFTTTAGNGEIEKVEDNTPAGGDGVNDIMTPDSTTKQPVVEGASTTKPNSDNASSSNGFAWYWWLIIAAVALTLWGLIAAARRRNNEA